MPHVLEQFSSTVFFINVFGEAEPFAAILIHCSRNPSLLGGLLRPEGPKFKAEGREWAGFLRRGSKPPPHQLWSLWEHCQVP